MGNGKPKGLKIALVVSLCFNLFFLSVVGVMLSTKQMLNTPKGRLMYIGRSLKLTTRQKMELSALTKPIREYRRETRQERIEEIDELSGELAKNNPDYEKINHIIGKMAEARGKFLGFAAEQLESFLKDLTLEQRQIIVKKIGSIKNSMISQ